jgi:L-lactate dehydrogenase
VRNAAYQIIAGKKATFYGIAGALGKICQAIASNSNAILPLSSHHSEIEGVSNICMAMPTLVNRGGVSRVFGPNLSPIEHRALGKSAQIIGECVGQILARL